jgi:5-oxopent-3-ene-1,2,5-tricarboxylate decarboxylase / 2-hydroxyhepta-2,4-diene-1,7-dioate isomerase
VALAWARTRAGAGVQRIDADPHVGSARIGGRIARIGAVDWDVPTRGTVIGTLLNTRSALDALADTVRQTPGERPPQAPVLYIKPANTWSACNDSVAIPGGIEMLDIGATLGVVMGARASRATPQHAHELVAGYTVAIDWSEPHADFVEPAVRQRCRDGFCSIGPWVIARDEVAMADALTIAVFVNGMLQSTHSTAECLRPVADLIADISAFMTLDEGDVLLTGTAWPLSQAGCGDRVRVSIAGVGSLENLLIAEARP